MKRPLVVLAVASALCFGGGGALAQTAPVAPATENKPITLRQGDIGFTVIAPPGWMLDEKLGRKAGALAALYPHGKTWADSDAVMYVNTIRYRKGYATTLAAVVAADVAETKRRAPKTRTARTATGKTRDNRDTVTWTFDVDGATAPTHDCITYQATPTGVILVALSSRTVPARDAARVAWGDLSNSVTFLRAAPPAKPAPKP